MTDDLRTRIADLARFHIPVDYAGYIECSCGTECKPDHGGGMDVAEQMWGEHVADAVIAALNLNTPVEYLSVDGERRNFMVAGHYTVEADEDVAAQRLADILKEQDTFDE